MYLVKKNYWSGTCLIDTDKHFKYNLSYSVHFFYIPCIGNKRT